VGCRAQVERGVRALATVRKEVISGWVRNLSTGEVEVVVFSNVSAVSEVEIFLRSGLRLPVVVQEVLREELQDIEIANKNSTDFKILRD